MIRIRTRDPPSFQPNIDIVSTELTAPPRSQYNSWKNLVQIYFPTKKFQADGKKNLSHPIKLQCDKTIERIRVFPSDENDDVTYQSRAQCKHLEAKR